MEHTSDAVNLLESIKSILESNGVDMSLESTTGISGDLKTGYRHDACYHIWIYNGCFEPVGRIKLHEDNLVLITRGEVHAHKFSLHDSRVIENIVEKASKLSKG
jgi:hypothetical protein